MTDQVVVRRSNGVLSLTLNRPEKKNALTGDMYAVLGDAISGAAHDPNVRCILVQANGDTFCAGADLGDFAAANALKAGLPSDRKGGSALVAALARTETPIVAAVNGRAVGVGATLLLHCDLVFMAHDASLSTPFANLALVPEAASSILLPARIGHARAFAMFVLGEVVDAEKALAWGLANAVVDGAALKAAAHDAARAVAARPPSAVRICKRLMRESDKLASRIEEEVGLFAMQLNSPEARKAIAAVREKRSVRSSSGATPA